MSAPKDEIEILESVKPEDLVKYGLIPEFIGRLPVVSVLRELNSSELVRILNETKNSLLKQYRKLFLMEGAELRFTREAIQHIAEQALEMKTGARALALSWKILCSMSCMTYPPLKTRLRS